MKARARRNPAATSWAILGASAAAIAAIATTAVVVHRRRKPSEPKGNDLPSVDEDDIVVPPEDDDDEWLGWQIKDATAPGYPWNAAVLHYDNWPTPGMFVDLGDTGGAWKPSNGFDSLVRALLGSALTLAGYDGPDAVAIATAEGQDEQAPLGRRLRRDVRRALTAVGSYNDLLFGQTNANFAGGVDPGKPCTSGTNAAPCEDGIRDANATAVRYMMNEQGRGLNWLPRHADLLNLIGDRKALERTTTLEGQRLPNLGGHQMVIWCPAFDLEALAPGVAEPVIRFLTWDDGVSTVDAPPAIRRLGVDLHGVTLPGVATPAAIQLP